MRVQDDHRTVDVAWDQPFDQPREWFFFTNRSTVWKVTPTDWLTKALVDFAFHGAEQDYERFRNDPFWKSRFVGEDETEGVTPIEIPLVDENDEEAFDTSVIPKFDELMAPFLEQIADSKIYAANIVYEALKTNLGLEDYDHITLASNGSPLFDNRAAWAKSYLKKADMVYFPSRGMVQVTDKGKQFLALPKQERDQFKKFADFIAFVPTVSVGEATPAPEYPAYSIDDAIDEGCFLSPTKLEHVLDQLRRKKNIILQGPPGTGKTWLAKRLAYALIGSKNSRALQAVQFHPNLSYEDFVRGWRPSVDGKLTLADGAFLEVLQRAQADQSTSYVIVIEEINRGNPAQIFGELLTLLEADKRHPDEALALSYRKTPSERIYIPSNLYVIGTMNIADRSLALVDLALRRRFAFIDLNPELGDAWEHWLTTRFNMPKDVVQMMKTRMQQLNQSIADDPSLGKQFQVGHSYVTPTQFTDIADAISWFKEVVSTEIVPLLEEYWFDDPNKALEAQKALLAGL